VTPKCDGEMTAQIVTSTQSHADTAVAKGSGRRKKSHPVRQVTILWNSFSIQSFSGSYHARIMDLISYQNCRKKIFRHWLTSFRIS
jgi:hypothetical protein